MRRARNILCGLMIWLMILACGCAAAQTNLLPALSDAQDQAVQRLSVMSQRDSAFEGIRYNNGHLSARGCQPVCMGNAVIAALDVQDRQTAIELVKESAEVLVIARARGKARMEIPRIETLLSKADRLEEAEKYPRLAEVISAYRGGITVLGSQLDAQTVEAHFAQQPSGMLVGRMTVNPDWTALTEIMLRLHEMGMDDARVCLASVSVGKESSGTPLNLGESGHYVTVLLHPGTFAEQGRIYVLDSQPRALAGEESGYTCVLRSPYPFALKKTGFAEVFDAGRISETVIRLSLADEAAWQSASAQEKARMLNPLILYGPGVLMITAD